MNASMIENQPRHVAIIMDGNGRWAQQRGLPRVEGHRRGVSTVRVVCETATELGLEAITLYCLSSENWKRPQAELDFLMHLLEQYLIEERRLIMEQRLVLRVIGRRDRLPEGVIREMQKTIEMSAENGGTQLVFDRLRRTCGVNARDPGDCGGGGSWRAQRW